MDIEELPKWIFVLFMVGLFAFVSLLLTDKFGDVVKTESTLLNQNQTDLVDASGYVTTNNDEVVTLSQCRDAKNITQLVVGTTCNLTDADAGTVKVNPGLAGATLSLNYTYKADSSATTETSKLGTAIESVSDWFGILILIGIMTVVLLVLYGVYYMFSSSGR